MIFVDQNVGLDKTTSEISKYRSWDHHEPLSDPRGRGEGHAYMPGPARRQRAERVS